MTSSTRCSANCPRATAKTNAPWSVQRADGSWLLDGRFPLDEFRELFDLAELPSGDFHTLAGLVITSLATFPVFPSPSTCSVFVSRSWKWTLSE